MKDFWHVEKPRNEGPTTHPAYSWYRVAAKDGSTIAYVVGLYEAKEMVSNHNKQLKVPKIRKGDPELTGPKINPLLADITAKAQPGAKVGPFTVPD